MSTTEPAADITELHETTPALLDDVLTITEAQAITDVVKESQSKLMKKGHHYGVIPGTRGKPTLLQPGAQMLIRRFGFSVDAPEVSIVQSTLHEGHREYTATVTIRKGPMHWSGTASCTTLERKYRYRNVYENGQKTQVENPDIADTYNTVLKMAVKRALVAAVLLATAASDMFTQDMEDFDDRPQTEPDAFIAESRAKKREREQKKTQPPASNDSGEPRDRLSKGIAERFLLMVSDLNEAKTLQAIDTTLSHCQALWSELNTDQRHTYQAHKDNVKQVATEKRDQLELENRLAGD